MEIGGGSAATLDAVTALMPQACGWLGETVRQSRR